MRERTDDPAGNGNGTIHDPLLTTPVARLMALAMGTNVRVFEIPAARSIGLAGLVGLGTDKNGEPRCMIGLTDDLDDDLRADVLAYGLAVLVGPDVLQQGAGHLHGPSVLGLIGACFFWGVGSIYSRYARNPAEPFTAAAMQQLCAFVWLLLVSVLAGEPGRFDPAAVSRNSFLAWIYLTTAGSLIGFTTFVWLMKHSTPAKVSTYAYVNPIVAVFLGWWILHEPVSPRIFLGAAVIIGGVVIITISKNRKAKPAAAPVLPAAKPQAVSR